jgi:hypothetical protein
VTFKIQPKDQETIQNITSTIEQLEAKINEIDDEEQKQELQNLLQNAKSALEDKDYAKAYSVANRLRNELQSGQAETQNGGSILSTVAIVAVIILILGGIGAVLYFSIIPEEDVEAGYGGYQGPPGFEDEGSGGGEESGGESPLDKVTASLSSLGQSIKDSLQDLTKSEEEKQYEQKDRQRRQRKKIRFNELDEE